MTAVLAPEESLSGFDVRGPLPTGTTLLEASAGTGKTWTIAALVTRYLAQGEVTVDQLLLVSFGNAASAELRDRVRARLVQAARALADPVGASRHPDPVVALLAAAAGEEVAARRHRLLQALASFDSATITTTHSFCQQMLHRLGIAADLSPGEELSPATGELVPQVVGDLFLRAHQSALGGVPFSYPAALEIGRFAVKDRAASLQPQGEPAGSEAEARVRFAVATAGVVEERKRRLGRYDYDDLLLRLRQALGHDGAVQRLRTRYRVVLVDEFQDTDPVQWEVLRTAFHHHATLVLIGDPKQAIYAFRGGDVQTYLAAKQVADHRATLAQNQRSDAAVVDALAALWEQTALGDPKIVVHPVTARHTVRRLLRSGDPEVGVRVRWLPAADAPEGVDNVRAVVAPDVASVIVDQLTAGTTWDDGGGPRPLQPGDIAVVVNIHKQAELVREALAAVGVPSVLAGSADVYASPAADSWTTLLRALDQPHRPELVRAVAVGVFRGWTAEVLTDTTSGVVEDFAATVRVWAGLLESYGVAALMETIEHTTDLVERLLRRPDGERVLTDLRHLAELLHAASIEHLLGTSSLLEWISARRAERVDDSTTERRRRLDSDLAAVQLVTVHGSKGLEYPVVHVPFGWDRHIFGHSRTEAFTYHDAVHGRCLDVGGRTTESAAVRWQAHSREESGEELRRLYVALTRAAGQVVVWWAPSRNTPPAGLHRVLCGDQAFDAAVPETVPVPSDQVVAQRLELWAQRCGGLVAVDLLGPPGEQRWTPDAPGSGALELARFGRQVDALWRRTSYSGLTAAAHDAGRSDAGVLSEPEQPLRDDEPVEPQGPGAALAPTAPGDLVGAHLVSPLADQPSGAAFGTLVHEVLEHVDTGAHDLAAELLARCRSVAVRAGRGVDVDLLAAGLLPVMHTPLGPLAGNLTLADVAVADRLPELDFELPLAGGDDPVGLTTLGQVADLLERHLPADDVLADYPAALRDPLLAGQVLRGYLTGSIDAVLRLPDGRYVVVDYKTNWLGPFGATAPPLSTADYVQGALAEAMVGAHYPLQALLYCVALHRTLRWRQVGYDPDHHLGGALYLFVRGMAGPETPREGGRPTGVFGWQPPSGLIPALSDLLATGRTT